MKLEEIWEIENLVLLTNSLSLMLAGPIWGGSAPFGCRFPPVKKEKAGHMKNWKYFHLPAAKANKLSRDVLQT
jgi:hypothetical protein